MKKSLFVYLLLSISMLIKAQTVRQLPVVIVPCESGTLLIDGTEIGFLEANDASKQTVTYGEHYLQLKTNQRKINLTVNINEATKNIIKIGCEESTPIKKVKLIDKQLSLSGLLSSDTEKNIFAFDDGDELTINSAVTDNKGYASIFIVELNQGNEIYRKERFKTLDNEKISINKKGVYKVVLYTDALFGKNARLTLERLARNNSKPDFNTIPKLVFDTTFTEVLKTDARVYSTTNLSNPNRTVIRINLPANTSYWTYWIGVDQAAQDHMKNFVKDLTPVASAFSFNPLVLYGMKLIPSLPMMNTTATINYSFVSNKDAQLFMAKQQYSFYTFKHANNVTTDYSLITSSPADLVLALENENTVNGRNVEVRVVAFTIRSKYVVAD